jgi:hypothetical protein
MADYFLLLDAATFEETIRPALAESWRRRSFDPCRPLAAELADAAREYRELYHTGADDPLLTQVALGLPFDRLLWRTLVGEALLFAAAEIPEFQTNADTLCCLLAPENFRRGVMARESLAPIQQVFRGSRDVTFGPAVYRPEHAGYSGAADVARLADYLAGVRPETWRPDDLRDLPDLAEEDRADELAFAREWFPVLADVYRLARDRGRVIVVESIY